MAFTPERLRFGAVVRKLAGGETAIAGQACTGLLGEASAGALPPFLRSNLFLMVMLNF